ncbi:MAG: pseudouridine synthase, partial [Bacteroidota bacterium]
DELVDLPLLISTNKRVSVHKQEGKKAQTNINSIEFFKNFSLLACEPITGRMHQIRVHLKALGCPIVGDSLYGGIDIFLSKLKRNYKANNRREEKALNHGYLLHAHSLKFQHPKSGKEVEFSTEVPKNFEVVLKMLRKYNA